MEFLTGVLESLSGLYTSHNYCNDCFNLDKGLDTTISSDYAEDDNFTVHGLLEMWHLNVIAVEPAYQGHGIGKTLMEWDIEQAREENVPINLEAS